MRGPRAPEGAPAGAGAGPRAGSARECVCERVNLCVCVRVAGVGTRFQMLGAWGVTARDCLGRARLRLRPRSTPHLPEGLGIRGARGVSEPRNICLGRVSAERGVGRDLCPETASPPEVWGGLC